MLLYLYVIKGHGGCCGGQVDDTRQCTLKYELSQYDMKAHFMNGFKMK